MKQKIRALLKNNVFQTVLSSLICVILGLLIGYIVLLFINPSGAFKSITNLIKNYFYLLPRTNMVVKNLGTTLVKTAPLILCSLSILFCYKVGLFNIGAAGQYSVGAGIVLYAALMWNLPWWVCILLGMAAGGLLGSISGMLKAYCNVNEVISGIMLNWISLYAVNMLLTNVKEPTSPYTKDVTSNSPGSLIPTLGLDKLFGNKYVTIAIPIAIVISIIVYISLEKTKFGYELKATGFNKNAAKYAGMNEKRNIIVTLMIGGILAGMGAGLFYLSGIEQWQCSQSSVPGMGFNGIAAAFLGGLNPIGTLFSSYFIQHITAGGAYVDKTMYCSQISDLISSIIIYLCGFVLFMKMGLSRAVNRREENEAEHKKRVSENEKGDGKL